MNIRLSIRGEHKTVATLQTSSGNAAQRVTHTKVSGRGAATLGWNRLYALLVAQAQHDGQTGTAAVAQARQMMSALGQMTGLHPSAIALDDLKYLLATPAMGSVTLADGLVVEPALSQLEARGQDLGDPYTPVDDPDPSFAESLFTEATRAMREGRYEGWWSPIERETLPIGAPGGPGMLEALGAPGAPSLLSSTVEEAPLAGNWRLDTDGTHRLIYLGQDRVLDWAPAATSSQYRVWSYDRSGPTSGPLIASLPDPQAWSTIDSGHELIWLGRDLQADPHSTDDLVLDWLPATGDYRLYRVDLHGSKTDGKTPDILPEPPLTKGNWTSIRAGKKLVCLGGNRVLDWEPATGNYRIWVLNRAAAAPNSDPLPNLEVQGTWDTLRDGHRIINLGGDRVLTWVPVTGWYRIWRYDRSVKGKGDPLVSPPLVEGHWQDIGADHELIWLGGRQVLDWQPSSGAYRIRSFDRTVVSGNPLTSDRIPNSGRTVVAWLTANTSPDYFAYIQPPALGRATPLINGRSSRGSGPDEDLTEPLDAMQKAVVAASAGDFVYFSAWWFMPSTPLTAGKYGSATNWGQLFAAKANEDVKIRILINDFDDIPGETNMGAQIQTTSIAPLDLIIAGLPAAKQDNLKYVVTLHPAHFGGLKSLFAGLGWRDTYAASHHQKFMVVKCGEMMTAFCGGIDIERRKTPASWSYSGLVGWHDLHVQLEGPITRDLEKEFVMRWNRENGSSRRAALSGWSGYDTLAQTPLSAADDVLEKKPHQMQMIRTISQDATLSPWSTERDDVEQVYRRAIGCATQFIYMENQYFRSTELADWVVAAGNANPSLIVIIVVLEDASKDDGANPVTAHGDWLQFTTLKRIMDGLGTRARLYTMKGRSVHAKFMLIDDNWMTIGSANANVRSFELDSELNVQFSGATMIADFRKRLWSHNLGADPATVGGWRTSDFLIQWDAVATANIPLALTEMAGEGIVRYDYNARPGVESDSIPDAIAQLDIGPDIDNPAGPIPPGDGTGIVDA